MPSHYIHSATSALKKSVAWLLFQSKSKNLTGKESKQPKRLIKDPGFGNDQRSLMFPKLLDRPICYNKHVVGETCYGWDGASHLGLAFHSSQDKMLVLFFGRIAYHHLRHHDREGSVLWKGKGVCIETVWRRAWLMINPKDIGLFSLSYLTCLLFRGCSGASLWTL